MRLRTANRRRRPAASNEYLRRALAQAVAQVKALRTNAHQQAVAELETRYASYGPGGWRWDPERADGWTLPAGRVLGCNDTTNEPAHGVTSRTANATVLLTWEQAQELRSAFMDGRPANWRGVAWRMRDLSMDREGTGQGQGVVVTVGLETVCPRDWTPADLPAHRR